MNYTEEDLDKALDELLIQRGEHPTRVRNPLYGEERELAKSLVKLFAIPAVINCVPYQTCPKCGGDGNLLRYNSPALVGMNVPICDVCEGKKIIPMAHCL